MQPILRKPDYYNSLPVDVKENIFKSINLCQNRALLCRVDKEIRHLCREWWHKKRCFMNERGGVLRGHTGFVSSMAWSPDGLRLATASLDNTTRVWNAESGEQLHELRGHTERVYSIAWSPDGLRLATASDDRTARVWDAGDGAE